MLYPQPKLTNVAVWLFLWKQWGVIFVQINTLAETSHVTTACLPRRLEKKKEKFFLHPSDEILLSHNTVAQWNYSEALFWRSQYFTTSATLIIRIEYRTAGQQLENHYNHLTTMQLGKSVLQDGLSASRWRERARTKGRAEKEKRTCLAARKNPDEPFSAKGGY